MNNESFAYKPHELEVTYFEKDSTFIVWAISGQEGSGTGTYSWGPDRSDS
ncbi:MAG: hypothetical protein LUC95_09305 [Lachnospiraceae bacterium]|nr:hypothetical protein [Lachnospiraceae bacterium]